MAATAPALNLTSLDFALKELYDGQAVQNAVYKDNPFFAMVPKKTDFVGRNYPLPVVYSPSAGRSAVFATAQSVQASLAGVEFLLTRVSDYSLATIDRQTLLASAQDPGSFIRGAKANIDYALTAIKNSLASAVFRSGTGTIGSGTISSGVITLANAADAVQFEVNMVIVPSASDGGAIIGSAGDGYVISVDRVGGIVTVAASLGGSAATPANWTGTMFFSVKGDLNAKMKGLAAWVPNSAPSATSFFGVDRSTDKTRLGGIQYDGSGQTVEEALLDASNLCAREGGSPDNAVMPFASYSALVKSLGAKRQYVEGKIGEVGFTGVRVDGAGGPINVWPDRNCPVARCWLLTMDTWVLASLGEAPHIQTDLVTGNMLRVYNADQGELRISFYGQLGCKFPGANANVLLGV